MKKLTFPALSKESEQKALELLKRTCEDQLKQYPEGYESDMKALQNPALTYNQRNCIVFRASEKKVCSFAVGHMV